MRLVNDVNDVNRIYGYFYILLSCRITGNKVHKVHKVHRFRDFTHNQGRIEG